VPRKSKGYRKKTRSLLRKKPRERGKVGLSKILHEYKPGQKVVVKINSSVHKGMPHRRYHGRIGVITNKKALNILNLIERLNHAKKGNKGTNYHDSTG